MLRTVIQGLITLASVLLGSVLFFFVILYDVIASSINSWKSKLGVQQLTDFRRNEEQLLHIPLLDRPMVDVNIILKPSSPSSDSLSFEIPEQLAENSVSLLLAFRYDNPEKPGSFEVELSLSDGLNTQETVFLFVNPFTDRPEEHYNEAKLWYKIPANNQFLIRCVDVQPPEIPVHVQDIQVYILATR